MTFARFLILTTFTLALACGNDDGSNTPADAGAPVCPAPTFTSIHTNALSSALFTACHPFATPTFGNLAFGAGKDTAYTQLQTATFNTGAAQRMRVVASQPDNSFLYVKVTNAGAPGGIMPPGGMLTTCEVDAIRTWITNGAAND